MPVAAPIVAPTVQGPLAAKVTPTPDVEVALAENPLPYCTLANGERVIVGDCVLGPEDWIWKDPDTGLAAL